MTHKEIKIKPWNVKTTDLVIAWVPGRNGAEQTWAPCLGVEKSRGRVTGQRCWEIHFQDPYFQTPAKHLVFVGEAIWVRRERK